MAIYHKMTIEEIQESFDRLVSDPTMRSLSAVLRIGQEQLDARGRLGKYKNIAFITGVTFLPRLLPRGPEWRRPTFKFSSGSA